MNNFSCKVCFEKFDRLKHKPHVLLNCTHTLCINCIENLSEKKCPTCSAIIVRTNPNWEILDLMDEPDNNINNSNNKLKNNVNRLVNEIDCLKEEILINHTTKTKENGDKIKLLKSQIIAKTEEKIKQLTDCQKSLCNQAKTIETDLKKHQMEIINNVKENTNRYLVDIENRLNNMKTLDETQLNVMLAELTAKKNELDNKNKQINKSGSEYIFLSNEGTDLKISDDMIGKIIEKQPQSVITMMGTSKTDFSHRDKNAKLKFIDSSVAVKDTPYEEQLKNYKQINDLMLKGVCFIEMKQLDKAIKTFEEVIQINPKFYQSYVMKANVLCSLNKYVEGIKNYNISLDLNPKQMDTLLKKAQSLIELKQWEQAIETYNKAIELFPNEINVYYAKAHTLREMKKFEECIDVFDQAYRIDPKDVSNSHVKALAYSSIGKVKQGIECIERALLSDRIQGIDKRNMLITKSEILRSVARFDEAVECLKKCLRLNPNDFYVIGLLRTY